MTGTNRLKSVAEITRGTDTADNWVRLSATGRVTRKPYRWPDTRKNRPSPHHFSDMPTIRPSELGLVNLRL